MSVRKEEAFQYILCMDLHPSQLTIAFIDKDTKKIKEARSFPISEYNRDEVTAFFTSEEFKFDFHSYVATSGGLRNTLIPVDLFNHTKAADVFKLNYPAPIDNLDYNRIPELGIVNIYELPLWIKSFFVIKFPRVKLIHPATVLLKGVFSNPTFSPKIHICFYGSSFYLLITGKTKLDYFNRFDFTTIADLVYHVLFVLEQKEMDQTKMDVSLYGVTDKWDKLEEVQSFFANKIKVSNQAEASEHFILTKQLLCV
jgi:hypothetical protein